MKLNGTIVGYDPGGDTRHGVAFFTYEYGRLCDASISTLRNAQEVIEQACSFDNLLAVGIDTLTCWGTGSGGWRPADRWLRQRYRECANSIVAPNSLYGAMGINGMSVLVAIRKANPILVVTETHPKVLYAEIVGGKLNRPEFTGDSNL